MPRRLTDEEKEVAIEKRKVYLREYMRTYMKSIYGDDKREYNRIAQQKRRAKIV